MAAVAESVTEAVTVSATASGTAWAAGAALFNAGEYWEAHEAWEPLWLRSEGQERRLLAGTILLAAALHKGHKMQNPRGGRRNYDKALAHLTHLPDRYEGVEVRRLEAEVAQALENPDLRPQLPLGKVQT